MKKINLVIVLFIALCQLVSIDTMAQKSEPSLKNKKVLFVYGGWKGHDPVKCRDLFVPWMRSEGAEVMVSDSLGCYKDSVLMAKIDLVVQVWTMGTIKKEEEKGLLKAVMSGVGLAGWHGGLGDSFRQNTNYQFMVGGQWVAHPGNYKIPYVVNIKNHKDYVTAGIKDFTEESEQYFMHVDPNVKVLATTTYDGKHAYWIKGAVMPVVWKKYYGEGRVFYSSLGHIAVDFKTAPESLEIMKRGIRWASESKYGEKEEWVSPIYK